MSHVSLTNAVELQPLGSNPPTNYITSAKPMSGSFLEEAKEPPQQSYQLRALARKTLAYQRRQTFVNVCCLVICPLAMVAIAAILGVVITDLVKNTANAEDILFCSSLNAMDASGLPITNRTILPTTPGATVPNARESSTVKHTNFLQSPPQSFTEFTPRSAPRGCVFWFEHDYPSPRAPYELNGANVSSTLKKDTTFTPDPVGGWFSTSQLALPVKIAQLQTYPWALVLDLNGVNSGSKPKLEGIRNPAQLGQLQNSTNGDGLLGNVATNAYVNIVSTNDTTRPFTVDSLLPVPFYEKLTSGQTILDADDMLKDKIQSTFTRLADVNKTTIVQNNQNPFAQLQYFTDIASVVKDVPWGALLFDKVDASAKKWGYTMQIGTDRRISRAASYPSENLRRIAQQAQLSNAFLKSTQNGANAAITHGFRGFPEYKSSALEIPAGTLIGRILFPFGITFLLPVFVIILVREKEDRIYVMMKMNGLSIRSYLITHYIHFYIMHFISVTVFAGAGALFKLDMFVKTNPWVYIILFFIWGHVQIALAFFFASFFSKSRVALVTVFLIVLASVMLNVALEATFPDGVGPAYYIWPPFAFYNALTSINNASSSRIRAPYKLSNLIPGDNVFDAMIAMVIEIVVFFLLAAYLNNVFPSEFGVQKPWYYIFSEPYNRFFGKKVDKETLMKHDSVALNSDEVQHEDDDVKAERDRVLNNQYAPSCPLVMKNMRKIYPSGKLAVKDVSLAVEDNSIFGLLGPNGAGKTSLIGILTGLYPATSGSATMNGHDIRYDMDAVYKTIGVCPQYDILWDDLSVLEHLLFYARLKGADATVEMQVAMDAIRQVDLQGYENRLSKGLSGGERRRLSIAIALTGGSKIVFFDEPTTGLDVSVRRVIWSIIQRAKEGRTIVLTTHSMEEAEILSNRIGIMAKGTLRCLGTPLHLKTKYGRGFFLHFACKADYQKRASAFVESLLPEGWRKLDDYSTSVSYEFKVQSGVLSRLFDEIEANKQANGIDDWGLSQTSLEEVFLHIIKESDADAE